MTVATMSAAVGALNTALSKAQGAIFGIERNREVSVRMRDKPNGTAGGTYKFKYATLDNIIHHIRQPLVENGLWFVQMVNDGQMVTRILHDSGEWMDCGIPMPDIKGSPQDIGSIISYFKRYSLAAAFGIVGEEDDDGEQGDRDVTFRARGAPRQAANAAPEVDEPPIGWGDWARGLIEMVKGKATEEDLDQLRDANIDWINGVGTFDRKMQADVKDAFRARRQVIGNSGF